LDLDASRAYVGKLLTYLYFFGILIVIYEILTSYIGFLTYKRASTEADDVAARPDIFTQLNAASARLHRSLRFFGHPATEEGK
jgi:hypothetical protein